MITKFFTALSWISLILALIVFIISYASYPDDVLVYINSLGEPQLYLDRNSLFYGLLAIIIIFNLGWLTLGGIVKKSNPDQDLTPIGISLSQIFFNSFFATSVYFISILNSRENFNYSNFGYLIYVTGGLLIAALIFTVITRFLRKVVLN